MLKSESSGYVSGVVAWPFDILIGQAGANTQSKCQAAMLPRQRRNQMIPTLVTNCRMIVQKLDVFVWPCRPGIGVSVTQRLEVFKPITLND